MEHIIGEGETVVCMPLMAQRPEVERVLQENQYTGFPVLDFNGVVVGFTMRMLLQQLLDEMTDTVDVGRVTDFHSVTIRASLPLEVAYDLFKRMEISHMIVVDNNHHPMAMLTRGSYCLGRSRGKLDTSACAMYDRRSSGRGVSDQMESSTTPFGLSTNILRPSTGKSPMGLHKVAPRSSFTLKGQAVWAHSALSCALSCCAQTWGTRGPRICSSVDAGVRGGMQQLGRKHSLIHLPF